MQEYYQQFQIKANQTILSIGCGGGLWEIMMAHFTPAHSITLVDSNPNILNTLELALTKAYFEKQFQTKNDCQYTILNEDAHAINLPKNSFDHIMFINSLHEMYNPSLILAKCQHILAPKGKLWIEEEIATHNNTIHEGCGKLLFTESSLKQLCIGKNFIFKNQYLIAKNSLFCYTI